MAHKPNNEFFCTGGGYQCTQYIESVVGHGGIHVLESFATDPETNETVCGKCGSLVVCYTCYAQITRRRGMVHMTKIPR